jgi:acyl-CoA synthetase (AMP-forming)/AMP-acid ligase II
MVEILWQRGGEAPDALAFSFLIDGEDEGPRLTFGEIDCQARSIAVALREVAVPGDRVLLLYGPGLEFIPAFFGCLAAGIIAVPAYPPRLDRPVQGLQTLAGIARDCQPRAVLTTRGLSGLLGRGGMAPLDVVPWIATDDLDTSRAHSWREPALDAESPALLQYTSGSTAAPKGVLVTHRNLMHNERMIQTACEHSGEGRGVCWVPLYHDLGLVAGVLQAVYHGATCVVMSPLAMLQRPIRWLRAISRYRADTTGGPPFAFDWCVQRISPEDKAGLDLSSWSIAAIGAEPIQPQTLDQFTTAFAPCGFQPEALYPCYGLAESTVFVAGGAKSAPPVVVPFERAALEQGRAVVAKAEDADTRVLVGCGHAWLDQRVVIAHPETGVTCPEGIVGEIWVAGPSVARGYWNQPEETERTFRAHLSDSGEGPFLRTGDLGFLRNGELFITGRIKDVLIIRGRNHYPQDIEETVQSVHLGLRAGCGAAFEIHKDGNSLLVVVQEVERRCRVLNVAELLADVREAVADRHELMVHDLVLLEYGSLPRTASGKVQRHASRAAYESGALRRWKGKGA